MGILPGMTEKAEKTSLLNPNRDQEKIHSGGIGIHPLLSARIPIQGFIVLQTKCLEVTTVEIHGKRSAMT